MVESRFRGLLEQFQIEVAVLKALDHPNIIRLEDVFETEHRIYMVMELMRGGELFDRVVERGSLSEEEASEVVRALASAIAYMHSMGIIHRDLKPENLLLSHGGAGPGGVGQAVKIIDFGLSKMTIDVWALGVIVFVLLCGCLPFDDDSSALSLESVETKFQLRFPSWAGNLSSGAKDLLVHLLDIDPRSRYTAEQALTHPWVSGSMVKRNNYLQSPRGIRRIQEQCGLATAAAQGGWFGALHPVHVPVPPLRGGG
ncbi:serine threonine-protein kinase dclk3 [Nannochloropsis gaditana CCMP526]|uniref:serine threonine-protein kinase dclk3 n=1 Tax=Nannochloropsis gaditana (strain CCMP526) TaxID=1093141 RepID=UPI00029F78B7|nr:serine threonine-protein kinase dclk3 [Nannochloropsis gaditana CCMP526]EKU20333.1 serine threonine-protein kinase dclk3 [Nannochloropsis gaditana CCMP526]|eukprot:XP_005856040.1 serine threonine-protein kinase dclk3 [Nannochloropsis gaditana CCMP526]